MRRFSNVVIGVAALIAVAFLFSGMSLAYDLLLFDETNGEVRSVSVGEEVSVAEVAYRAGELRMQVDVRYRADAAPSAGDRVSVWYNPVDPAEVFLSRDTRRSQAFRVIFSSILALLIIGLVFVVWRTRPRREQEQQEKVDGVASAGEEESAAPSRPRRVRRSGARRRGFAGREKKEEAKPVPVGEPFTADFTHVEQSAPDDRGSTMFRVGAERRVGSTREQYMSDWQPEDPSVGILTSGGKVVVTPLSDGSVKIDLRNKSPY